MSALPLKFLCPHCESLLRMLRDQVAVQPRFDCPACHQSVVVSVDSLGGITADRGHLAPKKETSVETADRSAPGSQASPGTADIEKGPLHEGLRQAPEHRVVATAATGRMAGLIEKAKQAAGPSAAAAGILWYLSPTLIAWTMAGICASALLGFALWYDTWPGSATNRQAPIEVADSKVPGDTTAASAKDDKPTKGTPENPAAKTPPVRPLLGDGPRDRLTNLGLAIKQQQELEGAFPAGTWSLAGVPAEQRFSWLARLVQAQAWQPVVPVVWDRPWHDPLNDSFVRRRIPELQNPSVSQLTGTDRYPATHYVGIAGVGADAAQLTMDDPRAGAFGDERRAKVGDFKAGLSNTMLMAGVQDQLGSWSSGGTATVRSFTREPYINGPDGFGTGQARSMLVLMADGSVRELSANIAPHVVRQMATLTDDKQTPAPSTPVPPLPVAAKVPAEDVAGLPPAPPPAAQPPPDALRKADLPDPNAAGVRKPRIIAEPVGGQPVKPPAAPAVAKPPANKLDPQTALSVKLAKYRRAERIPLSTVLDELAEMSGVDIVCEPGVLGPLGMLQLNSKVSVNLEGTTIRGVLTSVLQQVELSFKVERGQVHIIPAPPTR